MFIDIDGGWSSWNETFDAEKNCTIIERFCNNPEPSGNGQDCLGESVDSDNSECPSSILYDYNSPLYFKSLQLMENGVFGVNMVNVQEHVEVELKLGKENVIIPLQKMVEKNVMVPVQKTRIVDITKKIVQVSLKMIFRCLELNISHNPTHYCQPHIL